jgi:diketogulonate reductase-like aldo/keto reductase
MPYSNQPTVTASSVEIPLLGFGTWQLEAEDARRMVREALRIGYRHIDTAWIYKNEKAVGDGIADAVSEGVVAREDVFVTTKIWVEHFHRDALLRQAEESARSLGLTPDLLLLHWPKPTPSLEETIGALNEAQEKGFTRHIGLSNFPSPLFRQAAALSRAPLITNQVEYHPYLSQKTLIATARDLGSSITAWSPLAQGQIADDAVIGDIARAHGKTNGQVVLRWIIQQGVIAIPRTTKESRAAENFDIFDFELSADDMGRIHALARPDGRLGDWLDAAFQWDQDAADGEA